MTEGIFPTEMKKADTVPLYKSKAKDDKNNYRPMSLLLIMSKLLEKVMYNRTYNFLTKFDQIYTSQYGFRKGRSCQDTNRKLRVKCMVTSSSKQQYSDYEDVEYGTPQGSCLGPLLFLIFSNDLFRHLDYCNNLQFADDTTIYKGHRNLRYLIWCIEHDLSNLDDWFKANKLTLNVDKSVHMTFGKKNTIDAKIRPGNTELPRVKVVKFLGMWLDQNMNWNEHLSKLKLKLKRNMTLLQVGTNLLDTNSKKILYYAQIYSHLSYGLTIWGNMVSATKLNSLQKIQNKCIRKIDIKEKHVTNTYHRHRILKIKDALRLENCKLAYRLEHHILPDKLVYLFNTNQRGKSLKKSHNYNTRNKGIPNMAKTHCKLYNNSYLCSSIRDYQKLNSDLRKAKTLKKFNSLLKETLLTC